MSKYIYKNLDSILKKDSQIIKNGNQLLNKSDILNKMSQFFGWRHYNELKINIKNKNRDNFIDINSLDSSQLLKLQQDYHAYINKTFDFVKVEYLNKKDIKSSAYNIIVMDKEKRPALFDMTEGLFFNIKKDDVFYIESNKSSKINLFDEKYCFKFNNKDFILYLKELKKVFYKNNNNLTSKWCPELRNRLIDSFIQCIELDTRNSCYHSNFLRITKGENKNMSHHLPPYELLEYYLNKHPNKEKCKLLNGILHSKNKVNPFHLIDSFGELIFLSYPPFSEFKNCEIINVTDLKNSECYYKSNFIITNKYKIEALVNIL